MSSTSPDIETQSLSPTMIAARIDRLPALTRRHVVVLFLLTSLFLFDVIDLASFGYAAPGLVKEWGLSLETLGLLTSTAFVGMFLGGVVGGRLADRFGRKRLIIAGVMLFSLASLVSAFAPSPEILGVFRLFTGFGLQMATGAVLVMVSETFPKAFRGRAMALVLGIALFGTPLIAFIARIFVPMGMWHVVFLIGALGVIPALFAIKVLPESPRWLAVNGRGAAADDQVRVFESEYEAKKGPLPELLFDPTTPKLEKKSSILDIFRRSLIARTVVATLTFCSLILLNYGFGTWLPVILVQRGYTQEDALTFSFILSFASVAGAFVPIPFVDRIERKHAIASGALVMVGCFIAIGFVNSVPMLLAAGFLASLMIQAISASIYSYVPEIYPIEVRGVGAGFANGLGRVAGIFSGVIIAAVLTAFTVQGVFVYFALIAVFMAVLVSFGPITGIRQARAVLKREKRQASASSTDVKQLL